jgi:hypothetical protein
MAKESHVLGLFEKVEVISIRGGQVFKKEMPYQEALNIKKKKSWVYKIYQLGFSQFKIIN